MAYLSVSDFRYGMDRRRQRISGRPGTVWDLKNAHVTRGADIERAKKFVSKYSLPSGTFFAVGLRRQLYVFGSADLAATVPLGVQYQRLISASGSATMARILDAKPFAGAIYAIAEFDDGTIEHYYNGTRVSDWTAATAAFITATTVAEALADKINADTAVGALAYGANIQLTARTPGTSFTISGSATNGGADNTQALNITHTQANVAAVDEVRATATLTVTDGVSNPGVDTLSSVLVDDSVELLAESVDWSGSNESTAIRIATAINNNSATSLYTATAVGAVVTITALAGTGATPNGFTVVPRVGGTLAITPTNFAGGVTAVAAVAQVETVAITGVIEGADTFTVTINGTAYKVTGRASVMGTSVFIHKHRVWSPARSLWRYCSLDTPTIWDPNNVTVGADAGFLNVAQESEGNDDLVVAERYQGYGAVFSDEFVTVYTLDTDPANFAIFDTADATGTNAPHSVIRYGNNDIYYLDHIGVRSLRARSGSDAPFVSDVGNAIDSFLHEWVDSLTPSQVQAAIAVIEPRDGRYWLAIGGRIFVLSAFPGDQISAWSYYEPGFTPTAFVRIGKQLYVRGGNTLYLYGGEDGATYPDADELVAEVGLPFLDGQKPVTMKNFSGFDIAATNEWDVEILYDPNDETRTVDLGAYNKITANEQASGASIGALSVLAPKLTCSRAGAATLSALHLHFDGGEEK